MKKLKKNERKKIYYFEFIFFVYNYYLILLNY